MPQLRSFGSFAQTPNLGANYLGGANLAQRESEFQVNTQLERQKLQQQMQMAEMEAASRASALQQQMLRQTQELEIQKAYQQQQLGLQERKLALEEQGFNEELQQAAATTGARMAMQRQVEELIRGGKSPSEAFSRAVATLGPQADIPGSAYSDVISQSANQAQVPIGTVKQAEGELGKRGYYQFHGGPNSAQLVPPAQARVPEEVPGDPSVYSFGAGIREKPASREATKLEKKRDALEERLTGKDFAVERSLVQKAKDPKARLTANEKAKIEEYQKKLAGLDELDRQIAGLKSSLTNAPARATSPSGAAKQVGRFRLIQD